MDTADRPVGMVEIARRAGVSQKTVSRVVNGEKYVSDDVRDRVLAVISEVNYRPNAAARALVSRRHRRIGVVVVASHQYGPAAIVAGVERAARDRGYDISVATAREQTAAALQQAVDELLAQGIDALAISEATDLGHPVLTVPDRLPVVSFDLPDAAPRAHEMVVAADEVQAARDVTDMLLGLGHRTVHHVAGPPDWTSSRRREQGWREALISANRDVPPTASGDWSPASGFAAMRTLLIHAPTAVFVANDHMAIGAVHAIERSGLRVPRDVSVIGFDDIPEAAYLSTPLTTVVQDFQARTATAIQLLVDAIEGIPPSEAVHLQPIRCQVRETTAPPPA